MTFRTAVGVGLALGLACLGLSQSTKSTPRQAAPGEDWAAYGGNPEGTRYSALKQIDRSNVSRLQVAWTYDAAASDGRPVAAVCRRSPSWSTGGSTATRPGARSSRWTAPPANRCGLGIRRTARRRCAA